MVAETPTSTNLSLTMISRSNSGTSTEYRSRDIVVVRCCYFPTAANNPGFTPSTTIDKHHT